MEFLIIFLTIDALLPWSGPAVFPYAWRMQKIAPFLWFDSQAEEAAKFYTSLFKNSKIVDVTRYPEGSPGPAGSVMTVAFQIEGQDFTALNGGPIFKFTPAISFFVNCATKEEIDALWPKLSAGGMVMMPLQKYPFSEYYGWCSDKYGVTWQLFLGGRQQKIAPCLMFTQSVAGKAEEAMKLYMSLFPNSKVELLERYQPGEHDKEGTVKHARFTLDGQEFIAMDSSIPHAFTFNEAVSLVVGCDTQAEIDRLWNALSARKESEQCGWLKDKYGVSWQITPANIGKLMSDKDPKKSERAMQAMLKMKKLDIRKLQEAAEGK